MNFVAQNFYFHQKINHQTPKTRALLWFNNINLIFYYYKIFFFYTSISAPQLYFFKNNFKIYFFFHNRYFLTKIQRFKFDFFGLYTNLLTHSILYWNFSLINTFFLNKFLRLSNIKNIIFFKNNIFNQYSDVVLLINISLITDKFKNIFYYMFFLIPIIWYQYNQKLIWKQKFCFPSLNLLLLQFFGGYFFKIYKY